MADVALDLSRLLPIPWREGGRDPAIGLDALGLVLHIVRDILGIPAADPWDELAARMGAAPADDEPAWRRVKRPYQQGDLAVFRSGHVAVYTGGPLMMSTTEAVGVHVLSERRIKIFPQRVYRWTEHA